MSREKSSRVSALYILAGKGKPGRKTKAVEVVEGKGIPGDAHFEDARAPVSIAAADIEDWMAGQDTQGLCFERFKANLWIRIPQEELKRVGKGTQLTCGEAVLEITNGKARCFPECARVKQGLPCLLREACWYAVCVSGGIIREGDLVEIRQKNNE